MGAVLLVLAIAALLLGLNRLQHAGAAPYLLAAAALAVGFVVREQRAAFPIIDLRCFRQADFAVLSAGNVAVSLAGFTVPLLAPFFLSRIVHLAAAEIGLMLAVASLGTAVAGPIAGRLAARIAPQRLALAGAAATAVGQVLLGTGGAAPSLVLFCAWLFVQGAGLGLFQVGYFEIAAATLPQEQRGVAGSMVMMTRTLGIVTGATVLMLGFQTLRAADAAAGETAAFLTAFQGVFRLTALLPAAVAVAAVLSLGHARTRQRPG